jgi:hypothetical protein
MAVTLKNRGVAVTEMAGPEVLFKDGTTFFKYFCFPDTVDPRGPKGK